MILFCLVALEGNYLGVEEGVLYGKLSSKVLSMVARSQARVVPAGDWPELKQ